MRDPALLDHPTPTYIGASRSSVSKKVNRNSAPRTSGLVLHGAARYDLTVWLMTLGRERALRERILNPARLERGDVVVDVGCGTGTLAIAAKRRLGSGNVFGIDASRR